MKINKTKKIEIEEDNMSNIGEIIWEK